MRRAWVGATNFMSGLRAIACPGSICLETARVRDSEARYRFGELTNHPRNTQDTDAGIKI
jgi:hypothetical protein